MAVPMKLSSIDSKVQSSLQTLRLTLSDEKIKFDKLRLDRNHTAAMQCVHVLVETARVVKGRLTVLEAFRNNKIMQVLEEQDVESLYKDNGSSTHQGLVLVGINRFFRRSMGVKSTYAPALVLPGSSHVSFMTTLSPEKFPIGSHIEKLLLRYTLSVSNKLRIGTLSLGVGHSLPMGKACYKITYSPDMPEVKRVAYDERTVEINSAEVDFLFRLNPGDNTYRSFTTSGGSLRSAAPTFIPSKDVMDEIVSVLTAMNNIARISYEQF